MTDKHEVTRRRNKAMGDWIRQSISSPSMPLDLSQLEVPEPPPGAPNPPGTPPSVDGGAGTGGQRVRRPDSMNDLFRAWVRERPER